MVGRFGLRGANADRVAVVVLGVAFVVVGVLLAQTVLAMRSHEQVTRTALEDFAGFAADRMADALDATFSALFLDRIAVARAAHDGWGEGVSVPVRGYPRLSADAFPVYFSVRGDRVTPNSGVLDDSTRAWIAEVVVPHARDVYPRPAPYAVLRGPRGAVIVYRKEPYDGEDRIFGLYARLDRLDPIYDRLLQEVSILPRSVAVDGDARQLASIRLYLPQGNQTLFERAAPQPSEVVTATSFAGKAGRMAVQVSFDADALRARVPGAQATLRPPLLLALAALTFALLGVAVALTRRAAHLYELREAFVANVSHDLRTPLAQIRMFSETLRLDRLPDPAERDRALEVIQTQAAHLGDIVDNVLLAASRGDAEVVRNEIGVDALLNETIESLSPAIRSRGVTVLRRHAGPTVAFVDPAALRRIATNLLDNALKFGPRGQTVTVSVRNEPERLDLSVADEGPGVPRRERARVWQRFERLHERHPAAGGTGLGLAVVRELARRHGGDVEIEDAPGGGARVRVTLATAGPPA